MEKLNQNFYLLKGSAAPSKEDKHPSARSHPENLPQQQYRKVNRLQLINKLNFINFQDGTILLNFRHVKYTRSISFEVKPLSCTGDRLECIWIEEEGIGKKLNSYQFDTIYVNDGSRLLLVEADLVDFDAQRIWLTLPETCYLISNRRVMRHPCKDVEVQLIQNGSIFNGILSYFNSFNFHVELIAKPPQTFKWINRESTVNLIISNKHETIFTGECRVIKENSGQQTRTYILETLKDQIQRFRHKEFRSTRRQLTPSPDVVFKHPLTQKMVAIKAVDISGSGFSVEEDSRNALLVPGMIIPEMELNFGLDLNMKCKAQVVYRRVHQAGQETNTSKCGIALLDMNAKHHTRLLSLLQQVGNKNSYICNHVDMDALWDFFFESGFIYPDKYEYIQKNKEQIKETYKKLYSQNPDIARHFIYQDKGRIMGHMGIVRFFENTWLIHHHAARNTALNRAGLIVLNQIGNFTYDSHRLYSLHMDFLMCYYRPENKFPNRVFGGAAKRINNPKGCSIDAFAYFHHQNQINKKPVLIETWQLEKARHDDFCELENFYEYSSGGLLINALDLECGIQHRDQLCKEYQRLGYKSERYYFSLKKSDNVKAFFYVMLSDIGLNLSSLTNCIMIFVLDSSSVSLSTIQHAISIVMQEIGRDDIPVLLYPYHYAENRNLPSEKIYNLWILDTGHSDDYFNYVKRLLRYIK